MPHLYTDLGAPDTVEGRFELLTLHIVLLLNRLKSDDDPGGALGQALFDLYLSNLDGAMREMGVGDLAMGKRMRALGKVFYGRASAYEEAFSALPDRSPLEAVIGRTVLGDAAECYPGPLAGYIEGLRRELAGRSVDDLVR